MKFIATSLLEKAVLVTCSIAVASCAAEPDPKKAKDMGSAMSIRAAVAPCMISPSGVRAKASPGTIIGDAIVGATIKEGLNLIGNALAEAGKENVSKSLVSANVPGPDSIRTNTCLQIVRGSFDQVDTKRKPSWALAIGLSDDMWGKLVANRLATTRQPEFVFEAYFRQGGKADKASVYALSPTLVALFHPQEQRLFRFGKERDVLLELAFHGPNKKFDDTSNSSTRVHVGELHAPTAHYFQVPFADKPTPAESPWFTVPDGPFTVTAAVFETEAASQTLTFLAAIFSKSKDSLEEALKQTALKSARDEAQRKAMLDQADAAKKYNEALRDAILALVKCKGTGGVADIAAAASAVDSANVYALTAGRAFPFAVTPFISDSTVTNKQTCENVLRQVSGGSEAPAN